MFDTINNIYFDIHDYKTEDISDEKAWEYMHTDINNLIQILIKNHYILVIKELDKDFIEIQYNFSNDYVKSDAVNPYWMHEKEYNSVIKSNSDKEDFYNKLP